VADTLTYAVVRADHEYLWKVYGPANDMTGGYVEEGDLARLLRAPTRATARDCYANQIAHWFHVGPETDVGGGWRTDPKVREIAARHLCEEGLARLLDGIQF